MEKAEVLNEFFASVFTRHKASHISQFPEYLGRGWDSTDPPAVSKEQVQDHLTKLNSYKSMECDVMHPTVPSYLMLLPSHFPSYLKSYGGQMMSPMTGNRKTTLVFLKIAERKTQGTTDQ